MKVCKKCGIEKPLNNYSSQKNYPANFRYICKDCENEEAREKNKKLRGELNKLKKNNDEIIQRFNTLKSADQILKLLKDGFDVSWGGRNLIIFNRGEEIIHAKNATKEMYDLIFARYCIYLNDK
ncbi:hypothetical protein [Cetobacterium somerae]|uniref:hypothetical protein n=1 Tax=Cetobacterium somerae TaxID=188913 RepID=UPI0038929386